MTEVKDSSSLPLLLVITGAVLAVAIGGWFFLHQDTAVESPDPAAIMATAPVATPEPADTSEEPDAAPAEASAPDVDAELRKARLAADADILVFPATQSALYYYGRVLEADPDNPIANAELDAALAKVARTVADHLAAEEYDDAYEIATRVARLRPEHSLVVETQLSLDQYTESLVAEAIEHAQAGKDAQATEVLATAEALPGRNPDYFDAVRSSISDIQEVRRAAERDRAQRARLANDEARAAWVESIRKAIADGNLITPAGASARDLLAESNSWTNERNLLTGEVQAAMVATAQSLIGAGQPTDAEPLVKAAIQLGGDATEFDELNQALEDAYVRLQSNRVASVSDLVRIKAVPPRYPRRAQERELTGWVDVYFTVTETGETADVSVYQSDPQRVFDRAAVEAVEKWAFEPVEYRGQVISQRAGTRVVFQLE